VNEDALQQWIQDTVNGTASNPRMPASMVIENSTIADAEGRPMIRFPGAVPINLLPLMVRSPEISTDDFRILKETIFTPDILSDIVVDFSPLTVTFRGKPGVSAAETYARSGIVQSTYI
jgi:hypothetical protein